MAPSSLANPEAVVAAIAATAFHSLGGTKPSGPHQTPSQKGGRGGEVSSRAWQCVYQTGLALLGESRGRMGKNLQNIAIIFIFKKSPFCSNQPGLCQPSLPFNWERVRKRDTPFFLSPFSRPPLFCTALSSSPLLRG